MVSARKLLMDIIEPTVEKQYGGGLDDAYMTLSQRRDSAFTDPNANSAFASPMSQGGLPTIYRDVGGGVFGSEDDFTTAATEYDQMAAEEEAAAYGFDEFDQADADAGAAGTATPAGMKPEDTYISYDRYGRSIESGTPADVALNDINIRNAATLGGERYRDRFDDLKKIDPDSELTNLQLMQRGIDRDLYNKAGVPLANFLQDRGLATFGKGMRGMFEAYTPGDALYIDEEKAKEAGRGVYDVDTLIGHVESGLSDNPNAKAIRDFGFGIRYAKSGDTVADVTKSMEESNSFTEEEINSAAQSFGYSPNSSAQASQVYDSLNDARGSGMLQGLGLIAGGIVNPGGFVNSLMSSYDDKGKNTTPVNTAMEQVFDATGVSSLVDRFGIDKDNKVLSGIGTAYDIAQSGPGALVNLLDPSRRGVSNKNEDMTDVINPAVNQDLINSYKGARERIDKDKIDALDNAYAQIINRPSKEFGQMEYQSGRITPDNKTKSTSEPIDTPVIKEVISEEKEEAPEQKSTSFFDTVLNFFKSSGPPVMPDQDDLGASNDAIERKRVAKPTQQQVAAIVQEAVKIPEEVKKTITSAGLLPQYLALIEAGYTAEEAIKAVGLSAGTAIA